MAWAGDIDKYSIQSYRHNVDQKAVISDIKTMMPFDVPYADVWNFGFPCQDLSLAGKRKGMTEGKTRSGLFYEVIRLLDTMDNISSNTQKPKMLLAENVKGLKNYLPAVEEEFNRVGYKMYYTIYNSRYFGVPQNRERYFIVGVREDIEERFVFPESGIFDPHVKDILEQNPLNKYNITNSKIVDLLRELDLTESEIKIVAMRGRYDKEGKVEQRLEPRPDNVSNTLTTVQKDNFIYVNGVLRKLTPRESARLQGFPDDYEQVVSDSQFFKQMGNAVTVPVAREVALCIKEFLLKVK